MGKAEGGGGAGGQKGEHSPALPFPLFPSKNKSFCFILTGPLLFLESKTTPDHIYLVYFSF